MQMDWIGMGVQLAEGNLVISRSFTINLNK